MTLAPNTPVRISSPTAPDFGLTGTIQRVDYATSDAPSYLVRFEPAAPGEAYLRPYGAGELDELLTIPREVWEELDEDVVFQAWELTFGTSMESAGLALVDGQSILVATDEDGVDWLVWSDDAFECFVFTRRTPSIVVL